jgi:hypothetical protein
MSRTLISVVSNAYEPILERYLGHDVIIETGEDAKSSQQCGVLQEYSAAYLLIRDIDLMQEIPPNLPTELFDHQFDVIFPRQQNSVRHLARRVPMPKKDEGGASGNPVAAPAKETHPLTAPSETKPPPVW